MAATKEAARKDQDKPEPTEKTVTVQGMKVTISTNAMKSLGAFEAMDDFKSGRNPFAIVAVYKEVFGLKQYAAIKEHLEEKHGTVEVLHMEEFFTAALKKVSPNS